MNEKLKYYGSAIVLGILCCAFIMAKYARPTTETYAGLQLNYQSKWKSKDLKESYEHYGEDYRYQINFYKNKKFEIYLFASKTEKYLYTKGSWEIYRPEGAMIPEVYYSLISEPIESSIAKVRFARFALKGDFYRLSGSKKNFKISNAYQFPAGKVYERFYFKQVEGKYLEDLNNNITYIYVD